MIASVCGPALQVFPVVPGSSGVARVQEARASDASSRRSASPRSGGRKCRGVGVGVGCSRGVRPGAVADPEIPTDRSKPPTKPEWKAGNDLNTAAKSDQDKLCWMKQVREWLRVECVGNIGMSIAYAQELGARKSDWFQPDGTPILIVRMRKGHDLRAAIYEHAPKMTYLRANWPADSDRPTEVSLGRRDTANGDPGIEKMPLFPGDHSKPPSVAEWRDAREVNTGAAMQRDLARRALAVREWVKVTCRGPGLELGDDLDALGRKNSDWFGSSSDSSLDLVFRFKKGVQFERRFGNSVFKADWPKDADQPKTLKLQAPG